MTTTPKERNKFDYAFAPMTIKDSAGVEIRRPDTEAIPPARRGSRPSTLRMPPEITPTFNIVTDEIELSITGGAGFVPTNRTINTTSPLRVNGVGSADLSADLTLTVLYDNVSIINTGGNLHVGTINATQHANQTNGSLHALAIPGSPGTAGFLSGVFAQDLTNASATSIGAGTLVKRGASGEVVGAWLQGDVSLTTATTGLLRMRPTDTIAVRNNANSGDILAVSRSGVADILSFGFSGATSITIGPDPGSGSPPANTYMNATTASFFYDGADERLRFSTGGSGPILEFSDDTGTLATIQTTASQSLIVETNEFIVSVQGGTPIQATSDTEAVIGQNVTLGAQGGDPDTYGGGTGVVWFPVAAVEPLAAPTTGMYMWYFGGNLKAWKAGAGAPVNII